MNLPSGKESRIPRLTIEKAPRLRTLLENFHDVMRHRVTARAAIVGAPFEMLEGRARTGKLGRAQGLSLSIHLLIAALLAVPLWRVAVQPPMGTKLAGKLIYLPSKWRTPRVLRGNSKGKGGGGDRESEQATRGDFPRPSLIQLVPPMLPRNPNPRLQAEPTILAPPDVRIPERPDQRIGVPWARTYTDSMGPGKRNGMGTGCCGGIGDKEGSGVGNSDVGWVSQGGSLPQCVYCPSPGFSDEARHQKIQGTVMMEVVVTADGRAGNIRITKGLGLGLDERAVEAVRNWKFKPARDAAGRAVPVWIPVEVAFRLL